MTGFSDRRYDDRALKAIRTALADKEQRVRIAALSCVLNLRIGIKKELHPDIKKIIATTKDKDFRRSAKILMKLEKEAPKLLEKKEKILDSDAANVKLSENKAYEMHYPEY